MLIVLVNYSDYFFKKNIQVLFLVLVLIFGFDFWLSFFVHVFCVVG